MWKSRKNKEQKRDRNPAVYRDSGLTTQNRSDRIRTCGLYVPKNLKRWALKIHIVSLSALNPVNSIFLKDYLFQNR